MPSKRQAGDPDYFRRDVLGSELPNRLTFMGWDAFLVAYRGGAEAELDLEVVEQLLARHGVGGAGDRQRLHRDASDPDDLWTEITVDPGYVGFERPTTGTVWNLMYDLMVACGAGLGDASENVVVPSDEVRSQLPPEDGFNSVFVARSVDDLIDAPWPEQL